MSRRFNPLAPTVLMTGLGLVVTFLSSCSRPTTRITLSSGTTGGYYNRLAQEIGSTVDTTVRLSVQNQPSEGSRQNLQRLLDRQVDFALVQLDVANQAMREGKVQAIATLAQEHFHVIIRPDARLKRFADLQGKRVAVGAAGSGIRFTADRLLPAAGVSVRADESTFSQALQKLDRRQVDAVLYVGSIGASQQLRQRFNRGPWLRLLPTPPELVNYLSLKEPGSYQPARIPVGTYNPRPAIPAQDIPSLATVTVLVTRPDMDDRRVGLLTWSILDNARQFSPFYPELEFGEARSLLQKGLFYIHPAAQTVYEQGDPRAAWVRYWESNSDLQAGVFILVSTSGVGLLLRQWQRDRSKKLMNTTVKRINDLAAIVPHDPAQALQGIEELGQEHRLMFIEGRVSAEAYEQVQQKTQMFADQCRTLLEDQRRKVVLDTLLLLDDWQATLQNDPDSALQKLKQLKQQYREMLLSDQVDIDSYIELLELTLLSVMTLTPKTEQGKPHHGLPFKLDDFDAN